MPRAVIKDLAEAAWGGMAVSSQISSQSTLARHDLISLPPVS
jgi:hypothetical protein